MHDFVYRVSSVLTNSDTKWFVKLIAVVGLLFVIGMVIFQVVFISDFVKLKGSFDSEDYSIWTDATTNILLTFLYSLLLGATALSASENPLALAMVCMVSFLCLIAVDLPMALFYPLKLIGKCGINSFDNIMHNCRPELNTILGVMMEGSTPIVVGLIGVFHLIQLTACLILALAKFKRRKHGSYEVQQQIDMTTR